jgi:hypothetical protein
MTLHQPSVTSYLHVTEVSRKSNTFRIVKKFCQFMEPEDSLPCSQDLTICSYPELAEPRPQPPIPVI